MTGGEPQNVLPGSFRDPGGRVFVASERVWRVVSGLESKRVCRELLGGEELRVLVGEGLVVNSEPRDSAQIPEALRAEVSEQDLVFEHPACPFPSFPAEWSPRMLADAGALTLSLAERALPWGYGLKDATPYNVLFWGPRPVFIDTLSFEKRNPCDPVWLPYAQLVRTFLLPLLGYSALGWSLAQIFLARRDGIEPESIYPALSFWQRLSPAFFGQVTLPVWLGRKNDDKGAALYQPKQDSNEDRVRFILKSLFSRSKKALRKATPPLERNSVWIDYTAAGGNNYSEAEQEKKQAYVRESLKIWGATKVLDVGCNTGTFSRVAARQGAQVVAIDYDPVVIDAVYEMARAESLGILPLVVDLSRPTPATGWKNQERSVVSGPLSGAF